MTGDEDERHAGWRKEFEERGETAVRMMDSGSQVVPEDRIRFSRVWLAEREATKRDAREDKTLHVAARANRIAWIAIAIAAISAIKDIAMLIFK